MQWPRCTLAYAPPNIVTAVYDDRHIEMSAAHDMWAVGVMAYEAVVGHMAMSSISVIRACAAGRQAYPWEVPSGEQEPAWRKSRLRGIMATCLSRDPSVRPTAQALSAAVSNVGHATTMRAS